MTLTFWLIAASAVYLIFAIAIARYLRRARQRQIVDQRIADAQRSIIEKSKNGGNSKT